MSNRSVHLAGIGLMLGAMLMFSTNDALGKWLVATYAVAQILLIRSIAAMIMLTPFMLRTGAGAFRGVQRPGLQGLRIVLSTAEVGCFYLAVRTIPLADAMTFYLAGPVYVTALSALLLKEKVGAYRWGAVLVGFVGVLIALNPTSGTLNRGSLIALGGSLIYSFFMILTRQLRETPNVVLTVGQTCGALAVGAVAAPFAWTGVAGRDYPLLLLLGVVSVIATLFANQSLRLAPASVVVPYQYTLIVWASFYGFVFFGDVPRLNVVIGAAIVVASGIFIFIREQRLQVPGADEPALAER